MSFEKLTPPQILNLTIKDVVPHIMNKGIVFVSPSTSIVNTALFLIPLRELYTGGIAVIENSIPVGRIAPKHILQKILDVGYDNCLKLHAKDVMVSIGREIRHTFALREVLELFKDTKFGFSPVIRNEVLVGSISTRDFLPIIEKMNIERPVSTISSKMIFIDESISIENTLRIMSKKNLRKIAIKDDDGGKLIDTRSILGYLFSWEKGKPNLLDVEIGVLPKVAVAEFPADATISQAAKLLLEKDLPCSITDDKIITSWDIVMKVFGTFLTLTDMDDRRLHDY